MKRTLTTRILSIILALCTVFTMVPMVSATEADEYVETELVEQIPQETVPEETAPAEIPEVEMESEIPFGLKGMPEGYVLSEEQKASKRQLAQFGDLDALRSAVPGKDYVANEVIAYAENEAEARMIAEAYNGILQSFAYNIAVIELQTVSVAEAVALSADMRYNLPVVSQNGIVALDPVEIEDDKLPPITNSALALAPKRKEWADWGLNDPLLKNPNANYSNFQNSYQWWHDTVDTYAAWGVTTGESYVKVAVLDTGVNASHQELAGRVTHIDAGYGTGDRNGHGSNVAGIIAAAMNNGKGGAGIAPGVSILSVKVLQDNGGGRDAVATRGINAAVANGAWIINMSLGSVAYNQTYQDVISSAVKNGTTVIAAMGNNGTSIKCYPAAYKNVIAVAATDMTNNRTNFSNYGSWCDVAAPGYYMWSSSYESAGAYVRMNGTSQATPVVTGVAALYMSANGWVPPATMEKVLKDSCVKGGANLGKGIVNAANMFSKNKPTVSYTVYDNYGTTYSGKTVPCDSYMRLTATPVEDNAGMILYTTDGKSPSVKNGEVVTGTVYTGSINLSQFAGKSVTIKAMAINGAGIAGSVKTISLKVSTSPSVSSITVEGPTKLVSGKSATYKATVAPAKANQSVTWSIVEKVGMTSAKISSSGKLTTSSKQEGYVIIRATSKANSSKYKDFKVQTLNMKPVSSMALSHKSATLTLGTGYSADTRLQLSITKMQDSSKNNISPSFSGVQWTSSKTTVATVDKNGKVTAVAPGSATITCTALDGSGKSATCKITVKQWVTGIAVSGNVSIAPGSSATYKATCYPTNATSKSVTWSLQGAPTGTKISSSGKVTLPKNVTTGGSFKVVATAKDGSGAWGSTFVEVKAKCTGLYATASNQDSKLITKNSSGYATAAVLYTRDISYYSGNDTDIKLGVVGKNVTPAVQWTSATPSVATVDSYGNVKAVKAGTAKITAAALDGSGKKVTVTVTVRNPVSSMKIMSSVAMGYILDEAQLAFGKSASHTAVFADTYGAASNKAVTWDFEILDSPYYTNYVKSKGWIKISSSGKVTTSTKLSGLGAAFVLRVKATSKDDPSVMAYYDYTMYHAPKKMRSNYTSVNLYRSPTVGEYIQAATVEIYVDVKSADHLWLYNLSASSSNPDVAGVDAWGFDGYYRDNRGRVFGCYTMRIVAGIKKGSATVTVKANDGSGQSCKIKVRTY